VGQARSLFTGIVEEMGIVREVEVLENGGFEMTVEASTVLEDVKLGDSIAVNGTCLTVTRFNSASFSVGLAPETLRRTSLGEAAVGSPVNLERSLQPSSRMGGHFVQGHVDGTGTIESMEPEEDSLWVKVKTSPELLRYIVPKGYIAVDGTSLTVVDILDDENAFTFMLIAYTQQHIVVPRKKVSHLPILFS
jgi:riboflavin synthase